MITPDLVQYIKLQLNKNISRSEIIKNLAKVGWRIEDIEEGFNGIEVNSLQESKPVQTEVKKYDPYRESLEDDTLNPQKIEKKESSPLEELKIWTPQNVKPKLAEVPEIKFQVNIPVIEEKKPEILSEQKTEIKSEPQIETYKIGDINPINAPIKPVETKVETPKTEIPQKEIEPYKFEMPGEVKPTPIIPIKSTEPKIEESKIEIPKAENIIPIEVPKIEVFPKENPIEVPKIETQAPKQEVHEFIPTINKVSATPVETTAPISRPQVPSFGEIKLSQTKIPSIQNSMSGVMPRGAMLSSYSQDILNTNKKIEEITQVKKRSFLKWGIIITILVILGGMVFAFVEGYLKIPGSKFSFSIVKKDPKTIILNAGDTLSKLNSYKVENTVSVTFPALSNITTGLSSGETVNSNDVDSVSFNSKGVVNNSNGNLNFDYLINLKSSLLENEISSKLKYDGSNLIVDIPDLSQLAGSFAPTPTTVSMTPNEIGKIVPELSPSLQSKIKTMDIYDIADKGIPVYVKTEMSSIFKDFVNSLSYSEKENETINGVEVYHYELVSDRASTKKFLSGMSDLFVMNLSTDQKKNLDEAIGASTFKSMDIWVGKNDDNIYKFKFNLSAPLSKVLGLNDSGIAGNEVNLQWTTTFSDINVKNNIDLSNNALTMDQFIRNIRDIKVKNIISNFKPQASMLKNAVGGFGNRINPGNCANPNPGSLYSPLGHSKGASNAVGAISSSMTSFLAATNGTGLCFSTPTKWAISAPLLENVNTPTYFCADNTGKVTSLQAPITEASCK